MSALGKHAGWSSEEQEQTNVLYARIQAVIENHAKEMKAAGRVAILNSAAAALACCQGRMLAAIENPKHRKALRRSMDAMMASVSRPTSGQTFAQVFVVGGPKQ